MSAPLHPLAIALGLTALATALTGAVPAHADLLEFVSMDREIEGTCDLQYEFAESEFVDSYEDADHEDPWVSGVVAELFEGSGEAIGIADQDSYAQFGDVAGSIHMQGFASGSARSGVSADDVVDEAEADGQSRCRISFRVSEEATYTLSGTVWASGEDRDDEGWWLGHSRAQVESSGFGGDDLALDIDDGKIDFQREGVLVPGTTYRLFVQVDGLARADYDDDTGTAYSTYGGAGFEIDMFISSDDTPTQTLSFSGLKERFRD